MKLPTTNDILQFLQFWVKLGVNNKIYVVLIMLNFGLGYLLLTYSNKFEQERDDFKIKYDNLYQKYTEYVDKNQNTQNQLKDNCHEDFKKYSQKKDKEIKELVNEYDTKYEKLLDKYEQLITRMKK